MRNGIHKLLSIIFFLFLSLDTVAEPVEGYAVNLQILDKITSQIKTIEINVNDIYDFCTLKI